jgi:hypothetical protein
MKRGNSMKTTWRTVTHWTATALFAGLMLLSAAMYLSGAEPIQQGLSHLGYPAYMLIILGTAKALGAVALMQNRLPMLREWAYAGFTINLIGATASHLFAGDGTASLLPAAFLAPLAVSYLLRTESQSLRASTPGRQPLAA